MKKVQPGRESLRRLKLIVGCNASKSRKEEDFSQLCVDLHVFSFLWLLGIEKKVSCLDHHAT